MKGPGHLAECATIPARCDALNEFRGDSCVLTPRPTRGSQRTGSRISITLRAIFSAAASAVPRVVKLPAGYPDSMKERGGLNSSMVYSQNHVPSACRLDRSSIDRPS